MALEGCLEAWSWGVKELLRSAAIQNLREVLHSFLSFTGVCGDIAVGRCAALLTSAVVVVVQVRAVILCIKVSKVQR